MRVIVAQAERQAEAVEALGGEHGEIGCPHRPVAIPWLIFHVTYETAIHRANPVGGLLYDRRPYVERGERLTRAVHAVGELEQSVNQTALVRPTRKQNGSSPHPPRYESHGFRRRRHGRTRAFKNLSG